MLRANRLLATPTMVPDVTDRLWEIKDFVDLVDEFEPVVRRIEQ